MTTDSYPLATALWGARFAGVWLPSCYTTWGDTTHWAVEHSLHWVLDMVFRDDECRIRTSNAPTNFATCRHSAYNLYRKAPGKDSIRLRRKTAGWDDEYLASLIAA